MRSLYRQRILDKRYYQMVNWLGGPRLEEKRGAIKNLDIVQEVCPLYRNSQAVLVWVRGHNDDPGNELADEWANKARQQQLKK